MAGDLDLTEAIEAGKRAYLNAHTVSDAKAIRAAIEAAAPIIARQVAERQQADQKHCYPPGSAVPHVALCGATGEHMGQTTAEERARGVCSVCHGRAMEITRRQAAAQALRRFADAHRMPLVMFTRDDGSAVSVGDLLREEADRIERSAHVTLRAGEPAHIAREVGSDG